jgi:hypothetical protein
MKQIMSRRRGACSATGLLRIKFVTENIGFYGWQLAPNEGINQLSWLRPDLERFAGRMFVTPIRGGHVE